MAPLLLEPQDAATTAAMLAQASVDRLTMVARGSGTKLAWGAPTAEPVQIGAYLSTRHLSAPVQHFAGDLVATLPAGATLTEVNAILARERQWLPLDPPRGDRATIGGIVATNDSGPRRQQHGSTRDLIIGVEVALADGRVAKAGGRVVKNVAGYDLSRLMCGSFGSLAVITSATFKLAPLPSASRTVLATCSDIARAHELALAIAAAPLSPSAIELATARPRVLVRFETTPRAAERQARMAAAIAERAGAYTEVLDGDAEKLVWAAHDAAVWNAAGTVVKISVLPTEVAAIVSEFERFAVAQRLDYAVAGRAALGVLFIRVDGDAREQAHAVNLVRRVCAQRRGTAVVLEASDAVRRGVQMWNDLGSSMPLMRAVKARFDPYNILNPGRGPAGL